MGTKNWNEELRVNIEIIDEEHKKLFKMIKFFLSMHKVGMSAKSIIKYINDLTTDAHLYFAAKEEEMVKQGYPLLNQQINKHGDMKEKLRELKAMCKSEKIELITKIAYEISLKLIQEYLYKDDMVFADFCNRKEAFEDKALEGCHCDIHSLDNKFLGKGKIDEIKVEKSQMHITSNGNIPINAEISEAVKITINNKTGGSQIWLARVFGVSKIEISLFAPKILAKENRRKYLRVHKEINAEVEFNSQTINGKVQDISLGGILLQTEMNYQIGETVRVSMILLEKEVQVNAQIVRIAEKNLYGCEIKDLTLGEQDIVSGYIFANQRQL